MEPCWRKNGQCTDTGSGGEGEGGPVLNGPNGMWRKDYACGIVRARERRHSAHFSPLNFPHFLMWIRLTGIFLLMWGVKVTFKERVTREESDSLCIFYIPKFRAQRLTTMRRNSRKNYWFIHLSQFRRRSIILKTNINISFKNLLILEPMFKVKLTSIPCF